MATLKNNTWLMLQVFVLSFLIQSCSYSSKATKRLLRNSMQKSYDVVIVPGIPFNDPQWNRVMKGRVYWSRYLYEKGIAKNIMYSGSSVYSPYYEAKIMALYAEALGIPSANVFTETNAEHSTENIYYSYKKARLLGFKTMAVASDPFQTRLLRRFIRKKVSRDIALIPFVIDTLRVIEPLMKNPDINSQLAFNKDYKSITEREGFWKRLRGTRGLNIDTSLYSK